MVKLEKNETTISNSEWEVMRIVWTIGDTYASQIISQLQQKQSWSESTIKTLIRRLVNKDLLSVKKDGRRFIYSARVNQTEMMAEATSELLDRMCDMHKGEVILKLLANSPISNSDLAKIQKVIVHKKETAPDKVPCNCLTGDQHIC